ncbi:MAG: hypothetical protein ACREIS_05670 [Nitrospiraceae bacterium]
MSEALNSILGPTLGHTIARSFTRMEIAEREIREAMARHPDHAPYIDRVAFGLLVPPRILDSMSDEVYCRHARELLDRLATAESTADGTAAEMCAVLSESSLLAPLSPTATALYARQFIRLFPEQKSLVDDMVSGSYVDEWLVKELEGSIRRKLLAENLAARGRR